MVYSLVLAQVLSITQVIFAIAIVFVYIDDILIFLD